ncbi:MAG: recombinase family protein [Acutalibacteraceae bacterium]|nr:recombinase family protein [Acutalibacteraceae bacterium]
MLNRFENEVKRVAAYCRVSTDNLDQANSLESQQRYFNEYIKRNPLWELYEVYVDEGISGTSTKKRASFNRMIDDAKNKKFDLIITKEISRFARNTLDSIGYTRELKRHGIGVIFMNDNINTLDADAELRLTIMSSIAQEESRKTSDRVKWGQRRMMEQGVVFGRDMLGYDVRDGKLYINEEGAETVRLIYQKFLDEGKGTHIIAKELREAGIKTSTYMKDWSYTVILRILKNEKYCGDLIQQKTYTPDYLSHSKKYNKGEVEYVTIRNHHEPIISREIFEATQREIERRRNLHGAKNGFANRYALSGKIICAECGSTFIHRKNTSSNGNQNESWTCIQHQKYGRERTNKNNERVGCSNVSINEKDIRAILQYVIADVLTDRKNIIESVLATVSEVLKSDHSKDNIAYFENELEKIENKKERLLDMCLSGDIETTDYRKACERLKAEHDSLSEKLQKEKAHKQRLMDKEKIIQEIKAYVNSLTIGEEWNDTFYRSIVDKIIINKNREIDIHLKLIPDKWNAKILCGKVEIDSYNQNSDNQGTSQPISVNTAFNSGYGIE